MKIKFDGLASLELLDELCEAGDNSSPLSFVVKEGFTSLNPGCHQYHRTVKIE